MGFFKNVNHSRPRKWIGLENVGNLLSVDMRGVFTYLCEDIPTVFGCWLISFFYHVLSMSSHPVPSGVSQSWPGASLCNGVRPWNRSTRGGPKYLNTLQCSLKTKYLNTLQCSLKTLNTTIYHSKGVEHQVWRERCFILITRVGFNFFEVWPASLMYFYWHFPACPAHARVTLWSPMRRWPPCQWRCGWPRARSLLWRVGWFPKWMKPPKAVSEFVEMLWCPPWRTMRPMHWPVWPAWTSLPSSFPSSLKNHVVVQPCGCSQY